LDSLLKDRQVSDESFLDIAGEPLWSGKTQEAVFQINVTLLHPEAVASFSRFGILLIAKRFSPDRILANYTWITSLLSSYWPTISPFALRPNGLELEKAPGNLCL
jgi:hypothetical protein